MTPEKLKTILAAKTTNIEILQKVAQIIDKLKPKKLNGIIYEDFVRMLEITEAVDLKINTKSYGIDGRIQDSTDFEYTVYNIIKLLVYDFDQIKEDMLTYFKIYTSKSENSVAEKKKLYKSLNRSTKNLHIWQFKIMISELKIMKKNLDEIESNIYSIFEQLDKDKNGAISYIEFLKMFELAKKIDETKKVENVKNVGLINVNDNEPTTSQLSILKSIEKICAIIKLKTKIEKIPQTEYYQRFSDQIEIRSYNYVKTNSQVKREILKPGFQKMLTDLALFELTLGTKMKLIKKNEIVLDLFRIYNMLNSNKDSEGIDWQEFQDMFYVDSLTTKVNKDDQLIFNQVNYKTSPKSKGKKLVESQGYCLHHMFSLESISFNMSPSFLSFFNSYAKFNQKYNEKFIDFESFKFMIQNIESGQSNRVDCVMDDKAFKDIKNDLKLLYDTLKNRLDTPGLNFQEFAKIDDYHDEEDTDKKHLTFEKKVYTEYQNNIYKKFQLNLQYKNMDYFQFMNICSNKGNTKTMLKVKFINETFKRKALDNETQIKLLTDGLILGDRKELIDALKFFKKCSEIDEEINNETQYNTNDIPKLISDKKFQIFYMQFYQFVHAILSISTCNFYIQFY